MDADIRQLHQIKADILAAASHPLRIGVIEFLSRGERCVCDIAAHLEAGRSNISRHLSLMQKAGVLDCRKDGLKVYYRLKAPCILNFLGCLDQIVREQVAASAALLAKLDGDEGEQNNPAGGGRVTACSVAASGRP